LLHILLGYDRVRVKLVNAVIHCHKTLLQGNLDIKSSCDDPVTGVHTYGKYEVSFPVSVTIEQLALLHRKF